MLFLCPIIEDFWNSVNNWLTEIGYENYILSLERIILADVENSDIFHYIILICKKVIYNAMKPDKKSNRQQVIYDLKRMYSKRYNAGLRNKQPLFGKNGPQLPSSPDPRTLRQINVSTGFLLKPLRCLNIYECPPP